VSRWGERGWVKPAPKKPPPADGIKLGKAGTTWWGLRWIEALEGVLHGDAARLARGRTYARAGRTHDLVIRDGKVTAKVTGSRPQPYAIAIRLAALTDAVWMTAIEGMAQKAQFAADLLAGEMPKEIDGVFRAAGASLFPQARAELVTSCSCPDWGDPCKHVAATHYVLGEALDRDPFLLFELRGRTREQVLEGLRASRTGAAPRESGSSKKEKSELWAPVPKVTLSGVLPTDYDRPREPLPTLCFTFDPPPVSGAVLRQLGSPAAWSGDDVPAVVLAPVVSAAAEQARRLALAEAAPPEAVDVAPISKPRRAAVLKVPKRRRP